MLVREISLECVHTELDAQFPFRGRATFFYYSPQPEGVVSFRMPGFCWCSPFIAAPLIAPAVYSPDEFIAFLPPACRIIRRQNYFGATGAYP